VFVLVLLAGIAAAFVVTEDLKLQPDPIARPKLAKTFSPVCKCEKATARIAFRLRAADSLTLTIVDDEGQVVRTLLREASFEPGDHAFGWDGRDEDGKILPEGRYRARVELRKLGRLIEFPQRIRLDTTPPRPRVVGVSRRLISPDDDGRGDAITIRYRVDEPSYVILLVNGRRQIRSKPGKQAIRWAPRRLRPGLEELRLVAVDLAGNRRPGKPFFVQVRYLELSPSRLRVFPRRLITVRVSTDYPSYQWRLGRRRGSARTHALKLRAPAKPGRYRLTVSAAGRRDATVVLVRRRR
jgi:FlgD Ig-like domain